MIIFLTTLLASAASLMAAASDFRSMRIPNKIAAAIILLFAVAILLAPEYFGVWYSHVGTGFVILVITYIMFAVGMIGAGDAKYAAALGLWVGLQGLMPYMFYMALVGGLLGAATLVLRKRKPFAAPKADSWIDRAQKGENVVPYGIAITVGAWAALFHTGFLSHLLHEVMAIIS